jgi:hypothetical protein
MGVLVFVLIASCPEPVADGVLWVIRRIAEGMLS